ncbi:hypothetical protein GW17_00062523, partial [Ensete ventricosum]
CSLLRHRSRTLRLLVIDVLATLRHWSKTPKLLETEVATWIVSVNLSYNSSNDNDESRACIAAANSLYSAPRPLRVWTITSSLLRKKHRTTADMWSRGGSTWDHLRYVEEDLVGSWAVRSCRTAMGYSGYSRSGEEMAATACNTHCIGGEVGINAQQVADVARGQRRW